MFAPAPPAPALEPELGVAVEYATNVLAAQEYIVATPFVTVAPLEATDGTPIVQVAEEVFVRPVVT